MAWLEGSKSNDEYDILVLTKIQNSNVEKTL